ncbi:MAG: 50S ribosomal protein L6 [Candidatus Kerfeldbacteria bacterium]|nr:50S ribosomal protein L6 [Candidatus Kerfeldbacteria bacterium]
MSRIGKVPIPLPSNVTVTVTGNDVLVKGPKGELRRTLHPHVHLAVEGQTLQVTVDNPDDRKDRSLWGLFRMLLANMVHGVAEGFSKGLEVHGVGYRVSVQGKKVILNLGYSHPIEFPLPAGIEAKAEQNVLTLTSADNELLGETAARIRSFRKPEPYKGKGVRYVGETVRRKAGKVMKGAES